MHTYIHIYKHIYTKRKNNMHNGYKWNLLLPLYKGEIYTLDYKVSNLS